MAVLSSSLGIPCCRFPRFRPLSPCLHSQQQFLLWACSPVPMLQLPVPLHTCEYMSQTWVHRAMVRTICVFLILSYLSQINHFTLFWQAQMLPFCPINFPVREGVSLNSGISPLLQLPCPGMQVPSCFLSSFSLLFFILPCYAGIFIVLSGVQGLLLVFSLCSERTVAYVDVFLVHPWREMNSTSSTLLPSCFNILNFKWNNVLLEMMPEICCKYYREGVGV